jgi:hypothetical protein
MSSNLFKSKYGSVMFYARQTIQTDKQQGCTTIQPTSCVMDKSENGGTAGGTKNKMIAYNYIKVGCLRQVDYKIRPALWRDIVKSCAMLLKPRRIATV